MKSDSSETLTTTPNDSVLHAAAGNLAFLLSVIRCGESLSADEEAGIRQTIARLNSETPKPSSEDEPHACLGGPPPCGFCDTGLVFTTDEIDAIVDLGKRLDLSAAQVIKQALRVFQLQVLGEPDVGSKALPS